MPSYVHEVIVELLRDAECVRVLLALKDVTANGAATVEDATLTVPEIRADVVLVFGEPPTRLAVVVEVQRNRDTAKKFAWPFYEAAARARHECDACVLVFATAELVAMWASAPVQLGPMQADRAELYFDLIFEALDDAARNELEKLMNLKDYVPQNIWAQRMRAEGKAEGEAAAIAAMREALIDVLAQKGFQLDGVTRARVDASTDVTLLRTWISRAVRADSVVAIFED